jgi:hypothetical protein
MITALRVVISGIAISMFLVVCRAAEQHPPDYRVGSMAAGALPTPYSADPQDSWNRIFSALFTRDVTFRLTEEYTDGAPFSPVTTSSFPPHRLLSERMFVRRESGDRAIAPLYPSFFSTAGLEQLVRDPHYTKFVQALREASAEHVVRPPLQRALMQADLWAAYDMLYGRQSAAGVSVVGFQAQRAELLPLLARVIHKVALTRPDIRGLRDNYAAAAKVGVPPLFDDGSGWIEVEWRPERSHDHDAGLRTASRVFLKPRTKPADVSEFVNRFRHAGSPASFTAELEATALVTEQLLISADGEVVRSPLVIDVQIRRFGNDARGMLQHVAAEEFELSRQCLREDPQSGGFVHQTEDYPAYLSASGNDYRFASPALGPRGPELPVLGTLASRCSSCHGLGVGGVFTFSQMSPDKLPPVRALPPAEDLHVAFVATEKQVRTEFKALLSSW